MTIGAKKSATLEGPGSYLIIFVYILTFFFYFQAYTFTFYLLFFLAYVSAISSDSLSGILSDISSEILCGQRLGPAGTTAITSLQLRSGKDHSDPGLAVRVRKGPRACS